MSFKPCRIGLLGASRIGPKAIVAPAASVPSAVLAGVAARRKAKAQEFAKVHGVETVFPDYGALVAAPGIDLVYNALPISGHAEWTIKALEAGKHVLCEKPLAMNAAEARAMLAAADRSGARLVEAFHYRYHAAFRDLLARLAAGAVGEVRRVRAHFRVGIQDDGREIRYRPEHGGGAMMDLGCYPLNWVLTILQKAPLAVEARAVLAASGVDESLAARLAFEGGVEASVETSMKPGEAYSAELEIVGTEGRIFFDNPVQPHRGARLLIETRGRTEDIPVSRLSTYAYQLDALVGALESGERLPTEGASILLQQETLDRVYEAAGLGALRRDHSAYG